MKCNFITCNSNRRLRFPPVLKLQTNRREYNRGQTRQAIKHKIYKKKLREIGLFSLKKAGIGKDVGRQELLASLNYLKFSYKKHKDRIFLKMHR